ncbi:hypothetical protein FOCC_FOCC012222 [Frankliniella occidentalis]|nr:hypothetical protein FOCC_FOCC012222 [Frankliniella occidentalis]
MFADAVLGGSSIIPTKPEELANERKQRRMCRKLNTSTITPLSKSERWLTVENPVGQTLSADTVFSRWIVETVARSRIETVSSPVDRGAKRHNENTPVIKRSALDKPAHPAYVDLKVRQESFARWEHEDTVGASQLASAGFFYTNIEDKTICFSCGGGLQAWTKGDDPWSEHAFYFPKCNHVHEIKGSEFATLVQGERPATLTPKEIQALACNESAGAETNSEEARGDDPLQCKICLDKEMSIVFLPCKHFVSCSNCGKVVKKCVVCREYIRGVLQVYMS